MSVTMEQEQEIFIQLIRNNENIFLLKKINHPNPYQQAMFINYDRVTNIINEFQQVQVIFRELDKQVKFHCISDSKQVKDLSRTALQNGIEPSVPLISIQILENKSYDLIKMLGLEGMKALLVEFNLLLKNEFHSVNPNHYPNLTYILGCILQDQVENSYDCLLSALRNLSIYNEDQYQSYFFPLLTCIEKNINALINFPEQSSLVFIKLVQILNSDIFNDQRKTQNAQKICVLIETVWEKHRLQCLGFGRELYFLLIYPLERFQNGKIQWLIKLKRDLEEYNHIEVIKQNRSDKVLIGGQPLINNQNNSLYVSLCNNQNLDYQKYRINYLIGISPKDEIKIKYLMSQQISRNSLNHQLKLLTSNNKESFWFYISLTRYIVCLLDFEEQDSKLVRVGEFLLCLHEKTQEIQQLHENFKRALFFDWLFQQRDQDTHNIQAGIYFLSVLAIKKQYTIIQEYLYFLSQFCRKFSPVHKSSMIESVKFCLQNWPDLQFLLQNKILPEQLIDNMKNLIDQNIPVAILIEEEIKLDEDNLYEKEPIMYENSEPIQMFSQAAAQPEYQAMIDDSLESPFIFPSSYEADKNKAKIPIYKNLWSLTKQYLQAILNDPDDLGNLQKFIEFLENKPPQNQQIYEIVKEDLVKIYYCLFQSHFDDISLQLKWNILQFIVDTISGMIVLNSIHFEVLLRLAQINPKTSLILMNLASFSTKKELHQIFYIKLFEAIKPNYQITLHQLYILTEQEQFENIIVNLFKSKLHQILHQNKYVILCLVQLFTERSIEKLQIVLQTSKENFIDKILPDIINMCLDLPSSLLNSMFILITTSFNRLDMNERIAITVQSMEQVIQKINLNPDKDYTIFWIKYYDLLKNTYIYQLEQDFQMSIYKNIMKCNHLQSSNLIPLIVDIRNKNKLFFIRTVEKHMNESLNDQKQLFNFIEVMKQWKQESKLNNLMENIMKLKIITVIKKQIYQENQKQVQELQ